MPLVLLVYHLLNRRHRFGRIEPAFAIPPPSVSLLLIQLFRSICILYWEYLRPFT